MNSESKTRSAPLNEAQREQVRGALDLVCRSQAFNVSRRSRDFLTFVVEHALLEPHEPLKERTIGIGVFNRPASYSTGEDPIVRVQAVDVRRRLERFYRSPVAVASTVEISLPVGSYMPEFLFDPPPVEQKDLAIDAVVPEVEVDSLHVLVHASGTEFVTHGVSTEKPALRKTIKRLAASLLILAVAGGFGLWQRARSATNKQTERFWQPIFQDAEPVLIGLPKSIAYTPGPRLYDEYAREHPGAFQEEWQRIGSPLPLDPDFKMTWSDMQFRDGVGVGVGTTYAAVELSTFFARRNKSSNLRIGNDYVFKDIRKAPTVLLGAINNRWTMQFSAELPYRFVERDQHLSIEEQNGQKRIWQVQQKNSGTANDYALVVRMPQSASGHFLIIAAGIATYGSEAAVDFICNGQYLEEALKNMNPNWPNRNLAFVIETTVSAHVAGPPVIVSATAW